jgi:glycosyltransferase involved in cell wall biosynthesis
MNKPKVFLTGGDGIGWAVDEDLKLVRQALSPLVEFTGIGEAEVIHSLWWYELLNLDRELLVGKRIICHFTAEPFSVLTYPRHNEAIKIVGKWITRTGQATEQLRSVGLKSDLVPYLIDVNTFKPLEPNDPGLVEIRNKWQIPEDKYLIGSFQRDTEGADLVSPKLVKGPDIFLEILLSLQRKGAQFHVVLAGPRRGWLLRQFATHSISHTYVGEKTDVDDIYVNAK